METKMYVLIAVLGYRYGTDCYMGGGRLIFYLYLDFFQQNCSQIYNYIHLRLQLTELALACLVVSSFMVGFKWGLFGIG